MVLPQNSARFIFLSQRRPRSFGVRTAPGWWWRLGHCSPIASLLRSQRFGFFRPHSPTDYKDLPFHHKHRGFRSSRGAKSVRYSERTCELACVVPCGDTFGKPNAFPNADPYGTSHERTHLRSLIRSALAPLDDLNSLCL